MTALPRGVALVRIASPLGTVVLVSERLTRKEEETGRIAASVIGLRCPLVVLSELEIARLMREAAA